MNNKIKANKKGTILMTAGLLLIASALVLALYNIWDEWRANLAAGNILEEISGIMEEPHDGMIPDYILNPDMEMPVISIDGNEYVGVLSVPALNLSLPVMSDWSYAKLKTAPNRFHGSVYTDNFIIAGHNYRNHFGNLKILSPGDPVIYTDVDGNQFNYAVKEVEVLKGTETERMKSGNWDLTLFTCTLSRENRVTVRCEKTEL